jgi:hypothetical protein
MPDQRTFKIVKLDGKAVEDEGRYHGSPQQAAKKAFNQQCRKKGLKLCKKKITVQEITKGGGSKEYTYLGERRKLSEPKEVSRGNSTYTIEYETKFHKA